MTGHEAKIRRAERKIGEMEQLRAEVPERVHAGLSWSMEQGANRQPEREEVDRMIKLLTNLMGADLKKTRRELEELRRQKNENESG